jgi:2'-5' RNA ligase
MRLFIALKADLDNDTIFSVEKSLMKKFSGVKWVEKKNIHLTLKFLGEVTENSIGNIAGILSSISASYKKFAFLYEGIDGFPEKKNARVIFIPVKNPEKIVKLMMDIDKHLNDIGFKLEKSYIPHLTLGRAKKHPVNLESIKNFRFNQIHATAQGLVLIKSTLTPDGPIYEEILSFGFV